MATSEILYVAMATIATTISPLATEVRLGALRYTPYSHFLGFLSSSNMVITYHTFKHSLHYQSGICNITLVLTCRFTHCKQDMLGL